MDLSGLQSYYNKLIWRIVVYLSIGKSLNLKAFIYYPSNKKRNNSAHLLLVIWHQSNFLFFSDFFFIAGLFPNQKQTTNFLSHSQNFQLLIFEFIMMETKSKWLFFFLDRSSHAEVFCKNGVLRNFAKLTEKHLCQSLFFNKVAIHKIHRKTPVSESLF